jgi:uncharacterized membrane protein YbhN (UPF0104 family)
LRVADALVHGVRLWLAFAIVGSPVGYRVALLAACGSLLVKLVSPTPNGLGVAEWAVAGLAAAVSPLETAVGAAAALLDRAAEALVLVGVGLPGVWVLRTGRKSDVGRQN